MGSSPRRFAAPVVAAGLLVGLVFLAGCGGGYRQPARSSSVKGVSARPIQIYDEAAAAFEGVNNERVRRGMLPLSRRTELDEVAYQHARDLLRMQKLSHTSSDGRRLEHRLARLPWSQAGENLARNKGYDSPSQEAIRGWIDSPSHNENMFRPDFAATGLSAVYDPVSGFTYLVQVFTIPA